MLLYQLVVDVILSIGNRPLKASLSELHEDILNVKINVKIKRSLYSIIKAAWGKHFLQA